MSTGWRYISGFLNRYKVNKGGEIFDCEKSVLLVAKILRKYYSVRLKRENRWSAYSVHRILATTFIKNSQSKPQVNHKDGNKLNNNIENLEWCTASENIAHSFRTGLQKPLYGLNHYRRKFTEQDIKKIRASKKKQTVLAKEYNVWQSTISYIKSKRNWKHLK